MAARKHKHRRMSAQVVENENYQLGFEMVAGIDVGEGVRVVCARMPPAQRKKHRTSHLQTAPATVQAIAELISLRRDGTRPDHARPALHLLWNSNVGGGPPIVAGGLVWTIAQNGKLYGLDPATDKVRQETAIGAPANHFPTPGIGAGLLLAPSAQNVIAFRTTAAATSLHHQRPG